MATPGRLLDHIENKGSFSVRLMGLKMLVLDEADHLLDPGFRKDMEIVDHLPRQRQSLLFSATIPKEVQLSCILLYEVFCCINQFKFAFVNCDLICRFAEYLNLF